jgi:predicted metalloprotease with PDZ domain
MAGLRAGDRIHAVDGEPCADQAAMVRRLQGAAASCRVVADRRGRLMQLTLEAAAAPAD